MKRFFIYLLLSIFVAGCGGSASEPPLKNNVKKHSYKDEPLYHEQWALEYNKEFFEKNDIDKNAHINAKNALQKYSGKNITIAIIDNFLDTNHFEIKKNIKKAINVRDRSSNVFCNECEEFYHGSAVTGIIASNINEKGIRGLAPDVDIIFIKLDLNGYVSDSEFLDAFYLAVENKADIINCSWGTEDVSDIVKSEINRLSTKARDGKGVIFVFAAGNEKKRVTNDESALSSVIGVGSSDERNLRAIYSNFSDELDILAPGGYHVGISTIYPHDSFLKANSNERFLGTSASTPIVSATIALMLEANPNLTREDIQNILKQSSDKIGEIPYENGRNDYYGYGKLNVDKAIGLTLQRSQTPQPKTSQYSFHSFYSF